MRVFGHKAFGVWHQAKNTACLILQPGDARAAAIEIGAVEQRALALFDILFRITVFSDEATFCVGHRQLEVLR